MADIDTGAVVARNVQLTGDAAVAYQAFQHAAVALEAAAREHNAAAHRYRDALAKLTALAAGTAAASTP